MFAKTLKVALALSIVFSAGLSAFTQERGIKLKDVNSFDTRLINCETYSSDFDRMAVEFSDLIEESDFLVLVSRLGKGESNRKLNQRRLHNVRERLKARSIDAQKITVAEGEKVGGLGRVEVYAGGKLIEVFPVHRNQDICVECCGDDERFYPYKQRNKPNRKRRR